MVLNVRMKRKHTLDNKQQLKHTLIIVHACNGLKEGISLRVYFDGITSNNLLTESEDLTVNYQT